MPHAPKPAPPAPTGYRLTLARDGSHVDCPCWSTGKFVQVPCPYHDGMQGFPLGAYRASTASAGAGVTDKNFIDWESHVFGYGYGDGERHILPLLKLFFESFGPAAVYDYREVSTISGQAAGWLLINALCHADVIEYGCSPRFGFLTEKGKALREYVAGKSPEELVSLVIERPDDYIHCRPDHCNCDGSPCRNNPLWRSV